MAESVSRVARYGDDVECFLKTLPPPVPRYIYENSLQFHRILHQETTTYVQNIYHNYTLAASSQPPGQTRETAHALTLPPRRTFQPTTDKNSSFIIFLIEPSSFEYEFKHRDSGGPLGFFYEYDPSTRLLIIKMTSREHRCAARAMNTIIERALENMGLNLDFESFAGVRVDLAAGREKLTDEGWAPMVSVRRVNRPAVVLEVGVTETETKIREDARMWVDPTRGQANIAITLKIMRHQPLIKIEKWEWDIVTARPQVRHHIEITGNGGTPSVSGGSLLIPFHQIWRRATRYPQERDIVVDTEDLVFLATHVWKAMEMNY